MDLAGGFTFTGKRATAGVPSAASVVTRLFMRRRPDELERGWNMSARRLAPPTMTTVVRRATHGVFNGYAARNGDPFPFLPRRPRLDFGLDVQKKERSTDRPPILPPPAHDV